MKSENNWVKIQSFDKLHLAEIAKNFLIDNNIPTVILNKKDTILLNNSGRIELYVDKSLKERALKILKG